mgnify:FL=1
MQQFQWDGDFERFLATIRPAVVDEHGTFTAEFLAWETRFFPGEATRLREVVCDQYDDVVGFYKNLSGFARFLENDTKLQTLVVERDMVGLKKALEQAFGGQTSAIGYEFDRINNLIFVDSPSEDQGSRPARNSGQMGVQIEAIVRRGKRPTNLWFFLPQCPPSPSPALPPAR